MKLSDVAKQLKESIREFFKMMALGASACQLSAHSTLTTYYAYY